MKDVRDLKDSLKQATTAQAALDITLPRPQVPTSSLFFITLKTRVE